VVRPVFRINVKQSGSHDEYPHSQVDNIQDVIENKRLLYASRHDHHHDQRDEKGEEIRRSTWNRKLIQMSFQPSGSTNEFDVVIT
jgi:hypothetical protein